MKISTKYISEKDWNALPVIETAPENARYYIMEYCRTGHTHMSWYSLLDADLNVIMECKIPYTNIISGLEQLYYPHHVDAFVAHHRQEHVGPYIRDKKV